MNREELKLATVCVATGLAGVVTGAMSFVSFVDTRALLQHLDAKNRDVIKKHFMVLWPCGRDFMAPLVFVSTVANVSAWALTRNRAWLVSGASIVAIGAYTGLVLGEDIGKLRAADTEELEDTTRSFCRLHHARTGFAVVALGVSLVAMGSAFTKQG